MTVRARPFGGLAVLLLVLLAASPPAKAQDWLEAFNRAMFSFNEGLSERLKPADGETTDRLPPWAKDGVANVLNNLINEPLTAAAHAVVGDGARAWHAAKRFAINTTFGYLGAVDRGKEWGLPRDPSDLGLALCSLGVPAGPYVVLPFTGPRTLRDAIADLGFANLMIYGMLTPLVGFPPSVESVIVVEIVDVAATLAIARQIEGPPDVGPASTYEAVRQVYLAGRDARCAATGS